MDVCDRIDDNDLRNIWTNIGRGSSNVPILMIGEYEKTACYTSLIGKGDGNGDQIGCII